MTVPRLVGDGFVLREATPTDTAALLDCFASVEVARWWPNVDATALADLLADQNLTVWVVERAGSVVGLVQAYDEDDPQYRHAGLDLALDPSAQGQGLGPQVISRLVEHLVGLGHHRVVIDPNRTNHRAIRAYEKAGFRQVGVMRAYEWDESLGRWTDGVLMEWVDPRV